MLSPEEMREREARRGQVSGLGHCGKGLGVPPSSPASSCWRPWVGCGHSWTRPWLLPLLAGQAALQRL